MTSSWLRIVAFTILAGSGASAGSGPAEASTPGAVLARYLQIDSSAGPTGEAEAAELLAGVLREAGLAAERYVSPDGHTSLYCRLPANSSRRAGAIVLLHHLDVVPAGNGWKRPAFSGSLAEGAIWGRGAIDAKGLGVAHLAAFLDAARSTSARARDLVFLATAGEESGGAVGTAWLLESQPQLFSDVSLVLNEGGQNRAGREKPLWFGLEVAQKRPLWLELVSRGRGGHASGLAPASPTHELIRALARIVDRPVHWRLEEPAAGALTAQAALDPGLAANLARLPGVLATGSPEHSFPPGMLGMLADTLQVTTLAAADSVNVIAPEARARIDARLLPATDDRSLLQEIERLAGPEVQVKTLLTAPRVSPSSTANADYRALAATLAAEAPVLPAFISGVTDSRFFRERGIAAYGFSPFVLDGTLLATIHGADERMPEAELARGIERLRRVLGVLLAPLPTPDAGTTAGGAPQR